MDSIDGRVAQVGIQLNGSAAAVSGLTAVSAAGEALHGQTISLGVDASGITATRAELGGLREDARQASNEFSSLSRGLSINVDGSSVRQLTSDLGSATRASETLGSGSRSAFSQVEQGANDASRATSNAERSMTSAASSVATLERASTSAGSSITATAGAMSGLGTAAESSGTRITAVMDNSASAIQRAGGQAAALGANMTSAASGVDAATVSVGSYAMAGAQASAAGESVAATACERLPIHVACRCKPEPYLTLE
jgi:hypothetical protein